MGPNFKRQKPLTTEYVDTTLPVKNTSTEIVGGNSQTFLKNQNIPAQWWMLFHSQALNNLINQGFEIVLM